MSWKIPLFDPDLGDAERAALAAVIDSKWLTMGERTARFEREWAARTGVPHAYAVNSATAALHMAIAALDIGPGDEVIVPSLTFVATANAVRYCGATPVFADVESLEFWNIGVKQVEAVLSPRTKAIVVVHYGGYMCRMEEITAFAKARGLFVVEDVAHAPGASLAGRAAGAWGEIGCFSFFSNKNMTTGEGGMLTTSRDDLGERLRRLRSHGMTTLTFDRHKGHAFGYDVVDLGWNYRMSEMNAALGLVQMTRLDAWNARRKTIVAAYRERLARIDGLIVPFERFVGESSYHLMPVMVPAGMERERVMIGLKERGIQSSIHYRPVDTFTAYVNAGLGPSERVPLSHAIGARVITLPLYPGMDDAAVTTVCDALAAAMADARS